MKIGLLLKKACFFMRNDYVNKKELFYIVSDDLI